MATKTSILIFYRRLSKAERFFRLSSIVILIVVNTAGFSLTLLNIFQCHPTGKAFSTPTPPGARCTDIVTLYLSSAPVNILTDLAILFLPMPILTALCLPRKQKIILVVTFGQSYLALPRFSVLMTCPGLGGFVTIVDVVRIAYLQQA